MNWIELSLWNQIEFIWDWFKNMNFPKLVFLKGKW